MSLKEKFESAAEDIKKLTQRPSNEELLEAYGLYKQATVGDNNTSQPWAIQFEATAKWNAWTSNNGVSSETAMEKYVALVETLKSKYA